MILWRNIENYPFYHFDSDPRFPPFLLYVRWKSGVTFVRRCFRDGGNIIMVGDFISFVSKKTTVCILISFSYTVVGKSFLLKFHPA